MRKSIFLFVLFLIAAHGINAADVTFKASAPDAVIMGEQFQLTYTVNAEGRELRIPELADFDVLFGPSTSYFSSTVMSNGNTVVEDRYTYTYVLILNILKSL